jgi:hypothetical protein
VCSLWRRRDRSALVRLKGNTDHLKKLTLFFLLKKAADFSPAVKQKQEI